MGLSTLLTLDLDMYLSLTFFTLLSFFIFQYNVKKYTHRNYWLFSLFPIALYCLTYGFRKGWGTDFSVYSNLFEGNSRLEIDSYELLFQTIVVSLRHLSDNSLLFFVVCSAMTIFSYIYVLKEHRDVLGLGLSLFYLFTAYQASNLIRYFMALSIAYVGIDFALRKKWLFSIVLFVAAFYTHAGISIFIIMILPFFRYRIFVNLKYNIIFYVATSFISIGFIQNLFGDFIYKSISALNFGGLQLVKYADKDIVNNYILGTTWGEADKSIFYIILNWLYGLLYIYFGHKLVKKMPQIKNVEFYYQVGVFGIVFGNIANNTEILYRVSIAFIYLSSLIFAYIIKYQKRLGLNPILYNLYLLSVIYMCFFSVKQIYSGFDVLYVWD